MSLQDIVNINITRQTVSVARASFGVVLIVGANAPYTVDRIRYYSTLAAMASDGYATTDDEYIAAGKVFSQNPRPVRIATGRIDVGDADITATLDAIVNADNGWYGLMEVSHVKADQLLVAAWAEANKKIYFAGSQEAIIISTTDLADTTSLAAVLKAASYARTAVIFTEAADTEFPEAAAFGKVLPKDPGSYVLKFKTLSGITADNLTDTEIKNATDKYVNIYTEVGGVNIVQNGQVSANEWIDTIIFADWLESRIKESVYGGLVNNDKIPFTDGGIAAIESLVGGPLELGQTRGGISPFAKDSEGNQIGGYIVRVPKLEDVPTADKLARNLPDVTFTAWLAGAIQSTTINGILTV